MPVFKLLDETLAAAVTAGTYNEHNLNLDHITAVTLFAEFVRAGGGTSAKAWVQTSFDGVNWMDIANFAFTTTSANRAYNLVPVSVTSIVTPTDGSMADNTSIEGFVGPRLRTKLTTVGTYTGASTFKITAFAK